MADKIRQFIKYDRIFLALSVVSVILIAVFIYYLGNTHQATCDYYYLHITKLLYPFVIALPTILSVYTYIKVTQPHTPNPTNGQYARMILGGCGILIAAAFLYVLVGFGLFFGKTC